ncbi:DNA alkylation repair protein [Geodermatophilus sp. SYSU D00758]
MVTGAAAVLARLRGPADPARRAGTARYGIGGADVLGVTVAELRGPAAELGRSHEPAAGLLWDSGVHEARILAGVVEDPAAVDGRQLDAWAAAFDSWDLCDQVCRNPVRHTPLAGAEALGWSARPEPFVERAADDRPIVRKGAGWALRRIGERSPGLRARAVGTAQEPRSGRRGARWVGADAPRELQRPPRRPGAEDRGTHRWSVGQVTGTITPCVA